MNSTMQQLQEMRNKRAALEAEIKITVAGVFKDAVATYFALYPQVGSLSWTQYTPYFNDGDTCEFGANAEYAAVRKPKEPSEDDDDYGDEEESDFEYESPERVAAKQLLGAFDDDEYLAMFGDHAKVIVTKDGIEVEEYEHD